MPAQATETREGLGSRGEASASVAEMYLVRGEPLLSYHAAQEGLQRRPDDARLRRIQALALARCGDVEGANAILSTLAREGMDDSETLGMLARTHRDLGLAAADETRRRQHLEAAFELYDRAYRSTPEDDFAAASYAGINAAAVATVRGDLDRARAIAREVREICRRVDDDHARYWKEATLGEASLILGDTQAAAAHYGNAAIIADVRYSDMCTTRRQARLLARHLPGVEGDVTRDLRIPPVLAFTGHGIDPPGHPTPRFPAAIEAGVREALRERLSAIAPLAVYSSAACAAELLCLELVREMGGETHVVLPFPPEVVRESSMVDFAPGDWGTRFDEAIAAADSVTVASDHRARGSAAPYEYANLVLTGMGWLRSRMLDTEMRGLAACDPRGAAQGGSSASILALWNRRGLAVDRIELGGDGPGQQPAAPADASDTPPPGFTHEMRAMLFADPVGYRDLSEDQVATFVSAFLGAVADLNRRTAHRCERVALSGDGLHMVFGSADDAGHYALELSALANGFDWESAGLPWTMNLRIALHAGPVHCGLDPLTGTPIHTGPHTSRAARIEPIAPPGQVYASSAFAAVAAASGSDLAMQYVGRIPLAESYGTLPLYHVSAR